MYVRMRCECLRISWFLTLFGKRGCGAFRQVMTLSTEPFDYAITPASPFKSWPPFHLELLKAEGSTGKVCSALVDEAEPGPSSRGVVVVANSRVMDEQRLAHLLQFPLLETQREAQFLVDIRRPFTPAMVLQSGR